MFTCLSFHQENQLFLMYIPDPLRKQLEQKMLRQVEQVHT